MSKFQRSSLALDGLLQLVHLLRLGCNLLYSGGQSVLEAGQAVSENVLLVPQVCIGSLPVLAEVSAGCSDQSLNITSQLLRIVTRSYNNM